MLPLKTYKITDLLDRSKGSKIFLNDEIDSIGVIYSLFNTKEGKHYVGSTIDLWGRLYNGKGSHILDIRKERHRFINFNNIDDFNLLIWEIEEDNDLLRYKELYYIKELKALTEGYNRSSNTGVNTPNKFKKIKIIKPHPYHESNYDILISNGDEIKVINNHESIPEGFRIISGLEFITLNLDDSIQTEESYLVWITDGVTERRIKNTEIIPNNWRLGRCNIDDGFAWITNGVDNKKLRPYELKPKGWYYGMTTNK